MQKISKKASILIWAIFLSLIISVSFLSISTKITENLKNSGINNKNIDENDNIKNILLYSEKNTENIWNKTILIENKKLEKSLKNNENYEIDFIKNSIIDLYIMNSSIIKYELIWTKNESGILTWSLKSYETGTWKLKLNNYSWYTKIKLLSDNKFEIWEKKYKIIENIWTKEIVKTRGVIK